MDAAAVLAAVSLLRGRRGQGGSSQSKEEALLDDAHRHPKARGASQITALTIVVEVVAILAAVRWLGSANPDLIQPAIALIVGAHFLVFQLSPATRGGVNRNGRGNRRRNWRRDGREGAHREGRRTGQRSRRAVIRSSLFMPDRPSTSSSAARSRSSSTVQSS